MMSKFISLLGLILLLVLAWGCSQNRRAFPWRTVFGGLALQFAFAVLILKTRMGSYVFDSMQRAVTKLYSFAMEGAQLVFGPLADPEALQRGFGPGNAFIFAVSISATIILVAALSALFYHWGILQRVVHAMAVVMQRLMKTSGSESLAAAANVFMGQTEAPLLVRPYLSGMTASELLALMTGGMATIAGGVFVVYTQMGAAAGHLLTASVMSAPAALLVAKILLPETNPSETAHNAPLRIDRVATNSIDALCRGASEGLQLALNVMAMLVALVAVVALANFLFGIVTAALGHQLQLQDVLGWLNAPFAWLMGVPAQDCLLVGQILGERIVLNEFFGYLTLTQEQAHLNPRSVTIATYALCGFANFGSIAIQIGGIGALVPDRRGDLARLGLRSMFGGLIACYMTAAIVGILL